MIVEFGGVVLEWRGPAPYHFVAVPETAAEDISELSTLVTYGWGMIPVSVAIGDSRWTTSLWPKDGGYLVPLKTAVRRAEGIEVGDTVSLRLWIGE